MSQNSTSSIIILPSSHQPSSSSRYLSPFSVFLQHIHLSEQLIIQLSSSLHLPLSTLFWLHSIYASLPTESASLSSWNTILNYPSVAGTTDDSSQSDYDNDEEFKAAVDEYYASLYPSTNVPDASQGWTYVPISGGGGSDLYWTKV